MTIVRSFGPRQSNGLSRKHDQAEGEEKDILFSQSRKVNDSRDNIISQRSRTTKNQNNEEQTPEFLSLLTFHTQTR
jgi:hypothetical protein